MHHLFNNLDIYYPLKYWFPKWATCNWELCVYTWVEFLENKIYSLHGILIHKIALYYLFCFHVVPLDYYF